MSYHFYHFFEQSAPIQVDDGIKARSQRGSFAKNWWAARWIAALERLVDKGRLSRGRSYARKGQVLAIQEGKEGIEAKVQGSLPRPYKVTISLQPLSDKQWEQVIEALAERAIFTAQLLAGQMPQEIEEAFGAAGVSLFPDQRKALTTSCSCPDPSNPCKHIAATYYILGEEFDQDPFLLFRLRGRNQEEIMAALRAKRVAATPQLAERPADYQTAPPATPLDEQLDRYWEMGQSLETFPLYIQAPTTPLTVLRRLGQPTFIDETFDRLLAPAYQAISAQAIAAIEQTGSPTTSSS